MYKFLNIHQNFGNNIEGQESILIQEEGIIPFKGENNVIALISAVL
jgi:hypothetical protein